MTEPYVQTTGDRAPAQFYVALTGVLGVLAVWFAYFMTRSFFQVEAATYLGLHLALTLVAIVSIQVLGRGGWPAFPLALTCGVFFLAFVAKFYLFMLAPSIVVTSQWEDKYGLIASDRDFLLRVFGSVVMSAALLAVTSFILVKTRNRTLRRRPLMMSGKGFALVLILAVVGAVLTSGAMAVTGVAAMGAQSVELPFRLSGALFYSRYALLPGLFLLAVQKAYALRRPSLVTVSVLGFLVYGMTDMLLRSSRGGLIYLAIMLAVLLVSIRALTRKAVSILSAILLTVVLVWPLMSDYRLQRAKGSSLVESVAIASRSSALRSPSEYITTAFGQVARRIVGVEGYLAVVATGLRVTEPGVRGSGPTQIFTIDVMGFSETARHSSSPSLLGWFWLVGGYFGAVTGLAGFAVMAWSGWQALDRVAPDAVAVAQGLWASFVFQQAVGGVLDAMPLRLASVSVAIVLLQLLARISSRPRRRMGSRLRRTTNGTAPIPRRETQSPRPSRPLVRFGSSCDCFPPVSTVCGRPVVLQASAGCY